MNRWILSFFLVVFLFFNPYPLFSYQKTVGLTDKEIIERLTRLEEGQKALRQEMNKRFDGINKRFEDINKRFEDINKRFEDINRRFGDINRRFEDINRRFGDINRRFDDVNARIEDLRADMNRQMNNINNTMNTMMVVFGALVVAMMGLVFWDRKTLIEKAKDETIKEIETDSRLIKALRELAKSDKKLAEVMKNFGLL